jgi:hypothetical protein
LPSLVRTFYQFCGLLLRAWLSPTSARAQKPVENTETVKEPIPSKMLPLED